MITVETPENKIVFSLKNNDITIDISLGIDIYATHISSYLLHTSYCLILISSSGLYSCYNIGNSFGFELGEQSSYQLLINGIDVI